MDEMPSPFEGQVLPAKSLAALYWIFELPHTFAGIGVRMLK